MNKKYSYDIKVNRGKGFFWEGSETLSPLDSEKEKDKRIEEIKKKYNIRGGEYLNISNFNSVYC